MDFDPNDQERPISPARQDWVGRIVEIHGKNGEPVKAGEVLFEIQSDKK